MTLNQLINHVGKDNLDKEIIIENEDEAHFFNKDVVHIESYIAINLQDCDWTC